MIYDDISGFAAALPPMQALIGLDLGEKTIGVAVSDSFLSIATPLETVRRKKFGVDAARLSEIIAARGIGGVVLGLPRLLDPHRFRNVMGPAQLFLADLVDGDVVVVLGLPRNMDGSEGARCQSTRAFARNFDRLGDIPIGFWDERLSTVAAERALLEADTSRRRRAEVIDHVAAGYILQGVLDRLRVIKAQGASA